MNDLKPWKPAKAYAVRVDRHDYDRATITVLCPHCTKTHTHKFAATNSATAIRQPPCGLDVAYRVIVPAVNLWPAT